MDALDTDENTGFVELLGVAKAWQKPPLTVLGGRPDRWRVDDSLLAAAYTRYLSTRVGPSGFPLRDVTSQGDSDSWVVDDEAVDWAQTAVNEWSAQRSSEDHSAVVPRVRYHKTIKPWER